MLPLRRSTSGPDLPGSFWGTGLLGDTHSRQSSFRATHSCSNPNPINWTHESLIYYSLS